MSFFCGDVTAKEQLPGCTGSAMVAPAAAAVPVGTFGYARVRKRLPYSLLKAIRNWLDVKAN